MRKATVNCTRSFGDSARPMGLVLLGLYADDDPQVRADATILLASTGWYAKDYLSSPIPIEVWGPRPGEELASEALLSVCRELGAFELDTRSAIPILLERLTHDHPHVRRVGAWGLALYADDVPECRDRVLALADDESETVRQCVLNAIGRFGASPETLEILRSGFDDPRTRAIAARTAMVLGADAAPLLDRLKQGMGWGPQYERANFASAYIAAGGDRGFAVERAFDAVSTPFGEDGHQSPFQLWTTIAHDYPDAAEWTPDAGLLERLRAQAASGMEDSKARDRAWWALLSAWAGGDQLEAVRVIAKDADVVGELWEQARVGTFGTDVAAALLESTRPGEPAYGAWMARAMGARAAPLLDQLRVVAAGADPNAAAQAADAIDDIQLGIRWERRTKD